MSLVEIRRLPWKSLREDVAADDTFLTTFEARQTAYTGIMHEFIDSPKPRVVGVGLTGIGQDIISPVIAFWGKAADNTTCLYKLYGRRNSEGFIEQIAAGSLTLGGQLIIADPLTGVTETARWVDTITNTINWVKPVTPINAAGNDDVAYLAFNAFGLMDLAIMFDLDGGSGSDTTEMNAIITGA